VLKKLKNSGSRLKEFGYAKGRMTITERKKRKWLGRKKRMSVREGRLLICQTEIGEQKRKTGTLGDEGKKESVAEAVSPMTSVIGGSAGECATAGTNSTRGKGKLKKRKNESAGSGV